MDRNNEWCADERRIYRAELRQALGFGETWLNTLIKAGSIPPPRTDPGGKRQFWIAREARQIVSKLNNAAVPATAGGAVPQSLRTRAPR